MQIWPALAEWFGVELAAPLKVPLTSFMPKHEKTWKQIREKYALKDIPYDKVRTSGIQSNTRAHISCKQSCCVPFMS